jgi:membrane protease YdiL (CAAX protease family)
MQAIIISTSFLGYMLLLVQCRSSANNGAKDLTETLSKNTSLQVLNRRIIKTTPLMILSLVFYSANRQNNFLKFEWDEKSSLLTMLLSGLCFLVSVYTVLHLKDRISLVVTRKDGAGYFSLRVPGLIIYEMFFRGVLLGIFLEYFSTPVAIALNIILYAFAHAFSSRREFIGSFFFGLLLCFMTILNHSVYPAVLLHLFLALPYESILLFKYQLLTKKISS